MSTSSDREVKERLLNAANTLAGPLASDHQLLLLLDQVESCLSTLYQEPKTSIDEAISPLLMALVTNKLMHHPNPNVKVALASCLSEITRITAPDAPYHDHQMKEVFQLIVSSFANLSDLSSRSYAKRVSILTVVTKVRLCAVMLDLELEPLIGEMFQHFFKGIRDHHQGDVFSSMEAIMTFVLQESDDISQELLSPIIASLRNDKEAIAQKLGERVLESCAAKVKPHLIQAVESLRIHVDDYSPVIASICELDMSCVVDPPTPDRMAESGNVASSSPSERLLEAKLGKCKVELEKNQKMYVNDGLKKSKVRLEEWIVMVVIVFGVVLYVFS